MFNSKWCKQNLDASCFLADESPSQGKKQNEVISAAELDQIIKVLQDSTQKQSVLEDNLATMKSNEKILLHEISTLQSHFKTSKTHNEKLNKKISELKSELGLKDSLIVK